MIKYIFGIIICFSLLNCFNQQKPKNDNSNIINLLNIFESQKVNADSFHFVVTADLFEENNNFPTISDSTLSTVLDSVTIATLNFQTLEPLYFIGNQFPIDDNTIACSILTQESWFMKQSLLLFDKKQQRFLKAYPVAQFYGGDGGQINTESWLFKKNNQTYLYTEDAEHWINIPETNDAEPIENLVTNSSLYQWKGNQFLKIPNPDSVAYAKHFKTIYEE